MHEAKRHVWLTRLLGADKGTKLKAGDAVGKLECDRLGDNCISIYSNLCMTYRCEDLLNLRPDVFVFTYVILKSIR